MSIETSDFQSRLRVLLGLQGAVLTDEELSHMADSYPRCPGKEQWDVRQYVRPHTGVGAREYRVVRGSSVQDVFRSTRSEEHTSELQSHSDLVCRLLLEKKKKTRTKKATTERDDMHS